MTRILCKTKDMSRDEWLKARRAGIGGSDAAAVCGISRYRSPIDVFLDKTSDDPPAKEDNLQMKVGRGLEAFVAELWEEETGKKCQRRNAILQHDDYDFMLANIDRWVVGENAGLEIKTGSSYVKDQWEGGKIPPEYELQCHHYMAVTGADRWYIACLIGNHDFVTRVIERDEDTIRYLIEVERIFWQQNVLEKKMPAPDGSDASATALKMVYPEAEEGLTVDLDFLEEDLARLIEVKRLEKKIKDERNELEQKIEGFMGEAEAAWIGTRQVTWKNRKGRETVDIDRIKADGLFDKYKKQGKPYRVFTVGKKIGGK